MLETAPQAGYTGTRVFIRIRAHARTRARAAFRTLVQNMHYRTRGAWFARACVHARR